MADKAHEWTDEQIKELEEEIKTVYKQAYSDIAEKWDKYMSHTQTAVESEYKAYRDALDSGNRRDIRRAKKAYEEAVKDETIRSKRYRAMLEQTIDRISKANSIALDYINGGIPDIYVRNRVDVYHETLGKVGESEGFVEGNFTQVDENTIRKLITDKKVRLPYKKLDEKKDKRWNEKKVNSQLLQGILQGESTMTVAKRLRNVTNMNIASSIRNARTMMTSAQNEGRLDSYIQLKEEGLIIKKEWMATDDEHTRESHRDLDGEIQEIEETFSNGLMFPADPDGEPAEVYNCRCTMVSVVEGVKNLDGSVTMFGEEPNGEETDPIREYQNLVRDNGLKDEYIYGAGEIVQKECEEIRQQAEERMKEKEKALDESIANLRKEATSLADKAKSGNLGSDELRAVAVEHDRIIREIQKLIEEQENIRYKYRFEEYPEEVKKVLSKYREMGIGDLDINRHLIVEDDQAKKPIEWAYDKYPKSWVKSSFDYKQLEVGVRDRGFYNHAWDELMLQGYELEELKETAIHELGHRFEKVVNSILESESRYYDKRTQGEKSKWLGKGYRRDEKTRKDKFVDPYMGKDYGGRAYELVSMGFEYAYTNPDELAKDKDMEKWIFGILTLAE